MTEDEAKTKWCPVVPAISGAPRSRCIGSACMAWRWTVVTMGPAVTTHGAYHAESYLPSTTDGYCGLVGKP